LVVVMVPVLLGFAALTIDVGYLYNMRADLQNTADAAALGAASQLPDQANAREKAQQLATINLPNQGQVLVAADVVLGHWDPQDAVFTAGSASVNAVQVTTRRSGGNGNPVNLFFAGIFGKTESDVTATAIAAKGNSCFEQGMIAGRYVSIKELELEDISGNYCIYGRQGITVDELELEGGTVTLGALTSSTVVIDELEGEPQIVETDIQPTRAQSVNQLINGVENGSLVPSGITVVVLTGNTTFGSGGVVPQSNTAYVVNGNVLFKNDADLKDVILAVRGTITFNDDVEIYRTAAVNPDDLPLVMLATNDIILGKDVDISGGALIAGRDFIANKEIESKHNHGQPAMGLTIEAGRDIIVKKEFELEELDLGFAQPFGGVVRSSSTLVQ
jgi:hypothetical protein